MISVLRLKGFEFNYNFLILFWICTCYLCFFIQSKGPMFQFYYPCPHIMQFRANPFNIYSNATALIGQIFNWTQFAFSEKRVNYLVPCLKLGVKYPLITFYTIFKMPECCHNPYYIDKVSLICISLIRIFIYLSICLATDYDIYMYIGSDSLIWTVCFGKEVFG